MITSSDGPPADSSSWRVLRRLLGRLRAVSHRDDWLEEALDTLVALVDADRGLVSIREAGGDYVVHARGAEGALRKEEWQEASQSLVRRVHREGRIRLPGPLWQEGHGSIQSNTGKRDDLGVCLVKSEVDEYFCNNQYQCH